MCSSDLVRPIIGLYYLSIAPGVLYGITCMAPSSSLSGLPDSSNRVRGLNDQSCVLRPLSVRVLEPSHTLPRVRNAL